MEEIEDINIEEEYNKLSPAEKYYLNHKLAVKRYQQANMGKMRAKCKAYYYRKKEERDLIKRNNLLLSLHNITINSDIPIDRNLYNENVKIL